MKENIKNKRVLNIMALTTALFIGALAAYAHNGLEHVMGVVAAISNITVTVQTVGHKTVVVLLDPRTKFTHSSAPSSWKGLHVGERVVIHARENPAKQLIAVTVQWGTVRLEQHDDH